ncbi:MAG: hypothetical protein K2Y37_16915 [Pirellulales bacterium]|nr:hypothetical protein [Pirellulales bacterium]
MARQAHDREDLLAEATALVRRAELITDDAAGPVVFGLRANGCASVYLSPDWALHFNSTGAVRRGYLDGRLITAERGELFALERRRTTDEVELRRRPLLPAESAQLLADAHERLQALRTALATGAARIRRAVWEQGDPVHEIAAWIERLPSPLEIAAEPHAR